MAQSIPNFAQPRFSEPLAARSAEAAPAASGENAGDFRAHLAAEKPAQRSAISRDPSPRPARTNRDIEDVRREAGRDATPPAARAPAQTDEAAVIPKGKPDKASNEPCDKPDKPAKAGPTEGSVCELPADAASEEPENTPGIPGGTVQATPSGEVPEPPVPALPTPGLAADAPVVPGQAAPFATSEAIAPAIDGEAQIQQAAPSAAAPAIVVAAGANPAQAEDGAPSAMGAENREAAPQSLTSVPVAGVRDRIAADAAAALARLEMPVEAEDGSVDALAGKAAPAKGDAPEIKLPVSGGEGALKPREAAPRHAFADWVNEFANVQGALHRSGDLVGSLDRAVAGQPPAPGGTDALRPTPLQVLPIEIGMQAARGATRFQIRLDPAELGRVDVQLDIRDNGEVRASLVVDRVETLAMLKRDASNLQYAFEQAGLKQAADGLSFSLRGEGQNNQNAQREGGQHRRQDENADPASVPNVQIAEFSMRRVMIPNSSVDRVV